MRCHVNKYMIPKMSNLGLISKLFMNDFEKFYFYSKAKVTKSPNK